ncbi:MAG: sulfatase [Pirellulaceae bacterium]|nr:sulfatase [Pirellulaceae bacterium]
MNKRLTLPSFLLLSCVGFLSMNNAAWAAATNFVFIIADDCTFRDVGCYGGQAKTPNIDRLATTGMRFTQCFQAAPMCSPTRHNIYTGQYPVKTGAYPNHTYVKEGVKSIAHYLKPLGYRVALSGKTHIAPRSAFPFEYSGGKNPDMTAIDKLFGECEKSDTPFCLFACSNEPHSPWNKGDASAYPAKDVKLPIYIADTPVVREAFRHYLAEITYFDGQVGEILQLLERHQLDDNTLVIVVSEQGNSFPFAKWTCYDHGLQSAMIARWPGKVAANSVTDAMVEYTDITPTFVDIAGGKLADRLDGRSFLPVLKGDSSEHKSHVFGQMTTLGIINGSDCFPIRSVRSRKYKLILNLNHETTFTNACTKAPFFKSMEEAAAGGDRGAQRVVQRYQHRPEVEFYDIVADPLEQTNLAGEEKYAGEIAALRTKLQAWMKSQGDEGIATELAAREHQARNLRKNKKPKKRRTPAKAP